MQNWSGNYTFTARTREAAGTTEDLRALLRADGRAKAVGTRHCFNDIADTEGFQLDMGRMNRVVSLDPAGGTVTVEGGVRYGELGVWLHERGYALGNLASLPHISVAGGCATGTHGSGIHNPSLPASVRSMKILTASGRLVEFSADRDREEMLGATIHLGGLGVVVSLTLSIIPAYSVAQTVYEDLPFAVLEKHFEEVMGAGYSVSLFTDWRNRTFSEVWVKRTDQEPTPDFFGARAATHDLHPIKGLGAEHCTPQMGIPGPWHERLPHFRLGFTPSSGKELQTEYFVPREDAYAALCALEPLSGAIAPLLQISEIRCIAADECWMSPCYRRDSAAIHFTWAPDEVEVRRLLPEIERRLRIFGARPHWGKIFTMEPAGLYPRLQDFRELLRRYDPGGKFRNAYLDRHIFHG